MPFTKARSLHPGMFGQRGAEKTGPSAAKKQKRTALLAGLRAGTASALAVGDRSTAMAEVLPARNNRATLKQMRDMASLLFEQGKLEEAMAMFEKALRVQNNLYGAEHACVADTQYSMAVVLNKQGKLEEAVAMCKEALRVHKKVYGVDARVANTQYLLAIVFDNQGELKKAMSMYKKVVRLLKKVPDGWTPSVQYNMASALLRQGNLEEAVAMFEEAMGVMFEVALGVTKNVHGAEHAHVADTLNRMAIVKGKLEEAMPVFDEAHAAQRAYVADTLNRMAIVLEKQGKLELNEAVAKCQMRILHAAAIVIATLAESELLRKHAACCMQSLMPYAQCHAFECPASVQWRMDGVT